MNLIHSESHNSKADISQSLAGNFVSKRWLYLLLVAVASLINLAGILRLDFDTSLDALLSRNDPYLDEYRQFQTEFPVPLEIIVLFVPEPGQTAFSRPVLDAMADLAGRYETLPYASHVSTLISYFSPERQRRLFERPYTDYSEEELAELQDWALSERLLTNNLLAADASLAFASISLDADTASPAERLELANAAIALRDDLRAAHPELGIHISSDVLLEQSSQQAMIDDLTTLLPFVILVCVLVIAYCFRSATLGLAILAHAIFSLLLTIGSLGLLGFSFNSISIIAPLVVVIIAVANSVHIISIFQQAMQGGQDKLAAMTTSLAYNLRPISLAAITTAIGFSSLNLCSSPAIQDFGRIVAIGIVYAYLLTLALLPALLIWLARKAPRGSMFLQKELASLVDFGRRHDRPLFIVCTALAVLTLMLLPLNETDFNRMDFISSDSDVRAYYDIVSERIERGPRISYAVDTGSIDGAIEPAFLRQLEQFSDWLASQPGVESAASVVDVVKTVNRVQHQEDPAYYVIPDDINDVANYLNGYATVQSQDFPLSGFINEDWSTVTLFVAANPMSNQELIDLDEALSAEFGARFSDAELLHGSGLLLFARMDELVTVELLQGYSLSLALITLCLVIGLGSLYFGILSVIPNLLPATIVFGVWALLVGQLDPFVMMLFSISIGLVVDDTVHILSHYLEGRQLGCSQDEAISHAIKVAGPALSITTMVLAFGTTILIAANTLYFQQSAKLLVPIVILALVLDLLYLPTILRRFDKKSHPTPTGS